MRFGSADASAPCHFSRPPLRTWAIQRNQMDACCLGHASHHPYLHDLAPVCAERWQQRCAWMNILSAGKLTVISSAHVQPDWQQHAWANLPVLRDTMKRSFSSPCCSLQKRQTLGNKGIFTPGWPQRAAVGHLTWRILRNNQNSHRCRCLFGLLSLMWDLKCPHSCTYCAPIFTAESAELGKKQQVICRTSWDTWNKMMQ